MFPIVLLLVLILAANVEGATTLQSVNVPTGYPTSAPSHAPTVSRGAGGGTILHVPTGMPTRMPNSLTITITITVQIVSYPDSFTEFVRPFTYIQFTSFRLSKALNQNQIFSRRRRPH